MKSLLCVLCALAFLAGCEQFSADRSASHDLWAQDHGGELRDTRVARLAAIASTLHSGIDVPVTMHLLASPAIAAYSWRSGDIYLTSDLVDAASDDEVAAAIAHEMGHLLMNAQHNPAALRGNDQALATEEAADQIGIALLQSSQRSPAALVSLLSKAISSCPSESLRAQMLARITLIRAASPAHND